MSEKKLTTEMLDKLNANSIQMQENGNSIEEIEAMGRDFFNRFAVEDVAKTKAVVEEDAATPADTVLASEDGSLESLNVTEEDTALLLKEGELESPNQITLFRNSVKSDINTLKVNTPKLSELDKILQDEKKAIDNDPDLINNEEFVKNYNKNLEERNLLFNKNKSIAQKFEGDYIQRGYDSLRSDIPALKDLTFTTKEDFNNIQSEVGRLNNQIELDQSSIEPDILTLNSSSLSVDLPYIEGLERTKSQKRNLDNSILELKKENDDILAFQEGYQYFKNGEEVARSTMFSFLGSNEYEDLINKDLDKAKEIVQIKNDIPLQMLLHDQEIAGETGEYERTLNSAKSGFFNVFKKAPMSATASLINNFIDAEDTPKALEFLFGTSGTSPTVSIAKKAYDDAEKQSKETGQDVDDLFTINYDTELKKISDDIRGQQLYKSQDIIDLYDEGDYTGFINGAAKLSVESSSYLAAAMIPLYGTGIIANSVAINSYYDLRRDGVSPEKAKVAAGLNSLVAVADNFIFRGMVSNTLKDASAVVKNAKKVRNITISNEVKLQLGKTALNNLIKEPSTEFIQGSTESMIDQWAKGKPINYDLALRQGAIEASAAGPTTAVFSTIPGVQYLALKSQDFVKIQSINKEIEKLLSIDGESVLAENRNQQLKLLVDDYINIFETTETLATKSTKKEGAFLASLTAQEAILEKMINGRDVSDSQKKSLESRLKSISDNKNTMLDLIDKRPISEEEAFVTDDQVVVFDGETPVELKDVDPQSTRNVLKNGKLVDRKVFLGKDLIKAGIAKKLEVKNETATETTKQPATDVPSTRQDNEQEVGQAILSKSIDISDGSGRKGLVPVTELESFVGEDRVGDAAMSNSRETIDKLKEDIKKNGFKEPIVVLYDKFSNGGEATIIEGNHRYIAAKELGLTEIPVRFEKGNIRSNEKRAKDQMFPLNRKPIGKINDTRGVKGSDLGLTVREATDSDFVGEAVKQTKIEELRQQEQEEMLEAIPNAENYLTDGKVDKEKITNPEDIAKFEEIYNNYDKLISPLLEAATTEESSVVEVQEVDISLDEISELESEVELEDREQEGYSPISKNKKVFSYKGKQYQISSIDTKKDGSRVVKAKEYKKNKDGTRSLGTQKRFTGSEAELIAKDFKLGIKSEASSPKRRKWKTKGTPDKNKKQEQKFTPQEKIKPEFEEDVPFDLDEVVSRSEADIKDFEESALLEIEAEEKKDRVNLIELGKRIFQVTEKSNGEYSVSQARETDGKLIPVKDKSTRSSAIKKFNKERNTKKNERINEAQKLINETIKQERDKIDKFLDDAIELTSGKGMLFDGLLGLPLAITNTSLKIIKAAYGATKNLSRAIQAGYEYAYSNGYNGGEAKYKKWVLGKLKTSKSKTDKEQPKTPVKQNKKIEPKTDNKNNVTESKEGIVKDKESNKSKPKSKPALKTELNKLLNPKSWRRKKTQSKSPSKQKLPKEVIDVLNEIKSTYTESVIKGMKLEEVNDLVSYVGNLIQDGKLNVKKAESQRRKILKIKELQLTEMIADKKNLKTKLNDRKEIIDALRSGKVILIDGVAFDSVKQFELIYDEDSVVSGEAIAVPNQPDIGKGTFMKSLNWRLARSFFDTDLMFRQFLPKGKIGNNAAKWLQKNIIGPMSAKFKGVHSDSQILEEKRRELKESSFGKRKITSTKKPRLSQKTGIKLTNNQGFTTPDLNVGTIVYLYNAFKQGLGANKFINAGYSIADMRAVVEFVNKNKDVKKYADGLVEIYKSYLPKVNEALLNNGYEGIGNIKTKTKEEIASIKIEERKKFAEEYYDVLSLIYGSESSIPKDESYSPISALGKDVESMQKASIFESDFNISAFAPNSFERTTKGSLNIRHSDAVFDGYVSGMTNMVHSISLLKTFQAVLSDKNIRLIKDQYGLKFADELQNSVNDVIYGRNASTKSSEKNYGGITDWLNQTNAAIMFFNFTSALTQPISFSNYAFQIDPELSVSKKSYFNNFKSMLSGSKEMRKAKEEFDSDKAFVYRLKKNLNAIETADLKKSEFGELTKTQHASKVSAEILARGYIMTTSMDSFAIGLGGIPYYAAKRDQLFAKYSKDNSISKADAYDMAKVEAMLITYQVANNSQQSSNSNKLSGDQKNVAVRLILSFNGVSMQYNRIIYNAASNIKNKRGNFSDNISTIAYYAIAQNVIFNAIKSLLDYIGDDDEDKKRKSSLGTKINRLVDGLIRGIGIYGVALSVVKNSLFDIYQYLVSTESIDQSSFSKDLSDILGIEFTKSTYGKVDKLVLRTIESISPPLGAKSRKVKNAIYSAGEADWFSATTSSLSVVTSTPIDRLQNISLSFSDELEGLEKLALLANLIKVYEAKKKIEKRSKGDPVPKTNSGSRELGSGSRELGSGSRGSGSGSRGSGSGNRGND